LKDTNYQLFKNEFKINNFVSTFEYLNQNNNINKEKLPFQTKLSIILKNQIVLFLKQEKIKKLKLQNFYNLIYEYRNDCLIAAIQYNKSYYTDRDLKPNESIYLNLTIIPFGETKSPNLRR